MRIRDRATLFVAILSPWVVSACVPTLDLPKDPKLLCATTADCPSGYACLAASSRCQSTDSACLESSGDDYQPVADGNVCTLEDTSERAICLGGACVVSECGDEFVDADAEPGEVCDAGSENANTPDAPCRPDCTLPRCGDGVLDSGEECDDANAVSEDSCLADTCQINTCGDGVRDPGREACDDGNLDNSDACLADCEENVCGDGWLNTLDEACDDTNDNPNDGCFVDRSVDPPVCLANLWTPVPVAGGGEISGDPRDVVIIAWTVAVDRLGSIYVSDGKKILRLTASGELTRIAGDESRSETTGDGGPAGQATFTSVVALAVNNLGELHIVDGTTVRRIDGSGIIHTLLGYPGVSAPAIAEDEIIAGLATTEPFTIAFDAEGDLYIAEMFVNVVRKLSAVGMVRTVAGTWGVSGSSGDDGPAVDAQLTVPTGLAVGPGGDLFISDVANCVIRRVDRDGIISRFAGIGSPGFSGDGSAATSAALDNPWGIASDGDGGLLVADHFNHRIRRIDPGGIISTVAGNGTPSLTCDLDGETASTSAFPSLLNVAVGVDDAVLFPCGGRLVSVDRGTDLITHILGTVGSVEQLTGADATSVLFQRRTIAFDSAGRAHFGAEGFVLRRDANGQIAVVAGTGSSAYSGDGGPALEAEIGNPLHFAFDGLDNLYFSDMFNNTVSRIDASGVFTRYAGQPGAGSFGGDDGPARDADLSFPIHLALDPDGNLFINDFSNTRIRRVDPSGVITTFAGNGSVVCPITEGELATDACLGQLSGMVFLAGHGLLVADSLSSRLRLISTDCLTAPPATCVVTTFAGDGGDCDRGVDECGDDGPAVSAQIFIDIHYYSSSLTQDEDGNVYFPDSDRLRWIDTSGNIGTYQTVWTGDAMFEKWPGPGNVGRSIAEVGFTGTALYFDASGGRWVSAAIASLGPSDVYRIEQNLIVPVAGQIDPSGDTELPRSRLNNPVALVSVSSANGTFVATGPSGRMRLVDLGRDRLDTVIGVPNGQLDGPAPVNARLSRLLDDPRGVAYDPRDEQLFVSEAGGHVIRQIALVDPSDPLSWTIETLAGALDEPGFDDSSLAAARLDSPAGLFFDPSDRILYVADAGNHVVRSLEVDTGLLATLAGVPGFRGNSDATLASEIWFNDPQGVAIGYGAGGPSLLYIADTGNHRVLAVDLASSEVATVLGNGESAAYGDGMAAAGAAVDAPRGLAVDSYGNLFIAGRSALRLVPALAGALASGVDPVSSIYSTAVGCLSDVEVEPFGEDGQILLLDQCQGTVLRLDR